MRIIAGKHRGRRLATPKDEAIRPTTDRIRESLFSILGDLHDSVIVDAYAGTGALGCESLSRGARKVWFFDTSAKAITLVRENLATVGEEEAARVITGKFSKCVDQIDDDVDIVFLDPPYGSTEPALALCALAASSRARAGTLVILEQQRGDDLPEHDAFELDDQRTYGITRLTFLLKK